MNKDNIDLLDKTLTKVNDWLKFAEAKNGALIAVVCAIDFGVNRIALNLSDIPNMLLIYLALFNLFSVISLTISITSFIPKLKHPFWIKIEGKNNNDNPFFFGHACKYSNRGYLDLLNIKTSTNKNEAEAFLADQIIVNSKIAFLKYELFSSAAWIFLMALLTPLGALAVWALRE